MTIDEQRESEKSYIIKVPDRLDHFGKGGENLSDLIISFLLSIVASIVADYICKWLRR